MSLAATFAWHVSACFGQKSSGLAKASGQKAARYVLEKYPTDFANNPAVPEIQVKALLQLLESRSYIRKEVGFQSDPPLLNGSATGFQPTNISWAGGRHWGGFTGEDCDEGTSACLPVLFAG